MKNGVLRIALAGNPNCGKTTLFNAFTGARLKAANWPGVTVERKEGLVQYQGRDCLLTDLPGIYALSDYTMEETISRVHILSEEADVIVNVVDASAPERSLFLTFELIRLGKPLVVALNRMDVANARGWEIDFAGLSLLLGVPVIPISARRRQGLAELMEAVRRIAQPPLREGECPLHPSAILHGDDEGERIRKTYDRIEAIVRQTVRKKAEPKQFTEGIDRLLLHPVLGFPLFLGMMGLVFFLTFTVGDFFKGGVEGAVALLAKLLRRGLEAIGTAPPLISLAVDGILAGVGGVIAFLPNLAILFLGLAVLEDSGYMARVAYLADGLMTRLGLSGRAFLPMLLGLGCTVPAVLATRTLEDSARQKRTILALPFMSCSAKLPVYLLLCRVFFAENAFLAAFSLYLAGLFTAIGVAWIAARLSQDRSPAPLLIELPDYSRPSLRSVAISVGERVSGYLRRAGTVIFLASVVLWGLESLNFHGFCSLSDSFAAMIGRGLSPIFRLCGLGYWQIVVSLIMGMAGKEITVASLSVLYGITNITSDAGRALLAAVLGSAGFTARNAYAMLLFVLLSPPCVAAIMAICRETGSRTYTALVVGGQTALAFVLTATFYWVSGIFV